MPKTSSLSTWVTSRFQRPIAKRAAISFLFAISAVAWQGCVMDAGDGSQSAKTDPDAGAKTLLEKPLVPGNGIPLGCSRQWSSTAHDSVMFCPDPRPPGP